MRYIIKSVLAVILTTVSVHALCAEGLDGKWTGRLECGDALLVDAPSFSVPVTMIVAGSDATMTRDATDVHEKLAGQIMGNNVTLIGSGWRDTKSLAWNTQVNGTFTSKRFTGLVTIRNKKGVKARDCSVRLALAGVRPTELMPAPEAPQLAPAQKKIIADVMPLPVRKLVSKEPVLASKSASVGVIPAPSIANNPAPANAGNVVTEAKKSTPGARNLTRSQEVSTGIKSPSITSNELAANSSNIASSQNAKLPINNSANPKSLFESKPVNGADVTDANFKEFIGKHKGDVIKKNVELQTTVIDNYKGGSYQIRKAVLPKEFKGGEIHCATLYINNKVAASSQDSITDPLIKTGNSVLLSSNEFELHDDSEAYETRTKPTFIMHAQRCNARSASPNSVISTGKK